MLDTFVIETKHVRLEPPSKRTNVLGIYWHIIN